MPTPLEEAILGGATPSLPLPAQQGCQPSGPAGGPACLSTVAADIIPEAGAGPQAWCQQHETKRASAEDYWYMQVLNRLTCR